jgi:pyruvate,water dikinase
MNALRKTTPEQIIRWFDQLSLEDLPLAGGKGANLGELVHAGVPVPPGFVITTYAFDRFLEVTGLKQGILDLITELDADDVERLRSVANELRLMVRDAEMPEDAGNAIRAAYDDLVHNANNERYVAVRSSAIAERTDDTSFAGMNETYLNVRGADRVVEAIRDCWASLYSTRVLFYLKNRNESVDRLSIAVVVQTMVEADRSGVMSTINPATGNPNQVVIESTFGLGDAVASGAISPDRFEIDKNSLAIRQRMISVKTFMDVRGPNGGVVREKLPPDKASTPSLTGDQIRKLAKIGAEIADHYGRPQDLEWAIHDDSIYILQTRTVTAVEESGQAREHTETARDIVVKGLTASPGTASGNARVIGSVEEADKFRKGDILVTRMTASDWVPLMRKAKAIITDEGGMTAHAAIVSRELGIPCIVDTLDATEKIIDSEIITVDAHEGFVYRDRSAEQRLLLKDARSRGLPTDTAA